MTPPEVRAAQERIADLLSELAEVIGPRHCAVCGDEEECDHEFSKTEPRSAVLTDWVLVMDWAATDRNSSDDHLDEDILPRYTITLTSRSRTRNNEIGLLTSRLHDLLGQ